MLHCFLLLLLLVSQTITTTIQTIQTAPGGFQSQDVASYRRMIAIRNNRKIEEHNSNPASTFKMKAYPDFISLTQQEFRDLRLNRVESFQFQGTVHDIKVQLAALKGKKTGLQNVKAVFNVDLRKYNLPVHNQGLCGNCYAHTTVENVNIQNLIYSRNVPLLSYQQLTECSLGYYNNNGCNGGWLYESMNWIQYVGLNSEQAYPMPEQTFKKGILGNCKPALNSPRYKISGWRYFIDTFCISRVVALQNMYSISIAIAGGSFPFKFYKSGILSGCGYYPTVDHAVLLMGISLNTGMGNYWIVKNSWGSSWGENGYIRIDPTNDSCNVCYAGTFPLV